MSNLEKLEQYKREILTLQDEIRAEKEKYNKIKWISKEAKEIGARIKDLESKLTKADFKKRIVLNNLYAIAIEVIEKQGDEIIKPFLNRNIGEKTLEKIEDNFNSILVPLIGVKITIRHDYYTNGYQNIINAKRFSFYCSAIDLDTCYYIENDAFKCPYNLEVINQVEDVEAEAEKLTKAYYEMIEKIKSYEDEMKALHDDFSKIYHRNTYTNEVSNVSRALFYCPRV